MDNVKAQYDVAKKTITENGSKSILYISGKNDAFVTADRLAGMKKLADEMGLKLYVRNGEFSELKARELKRLFEGGTGRTVITKHELVKLYYKDVIV